MNSASAVKGKSKKSVFLSVVIPAFNEFEGIQNTLGEVVKNIPPDLIKDYEVVVVDDGSTDKTAQAVQEFMKSNSKIRLISMRGNQGHMAAITAGLESARGEWILTMDADLQDPPEMIMPMIRIAQENECQVVQGVRSARDTDSLFKRASAKLFYRWMKYLIGPKAISQGADFRLIHKEVRDEILKLPERNKVYRLLIPYLGFEIKTIDFPRGERAFGYTKYPLKKMVELAIDSTISFSSKPLRSLTLIGGSLSILMLTMSILTALLQFFIPTVSGWTSIVCLVLAGNALVLAAIGLIGEYISKIYEQVQGRPTAIWHELDSGQKRQPRNHSGNERMKSVSRKPMREVFSRQALAPIFAGTIGIFLCIWSFHWGYLSPFEWQWAENSQPGLLDVATSVASQQDFIRSSWQFPVGLVENYGYPVGTSLLQTATALIPTILLKVFAGVFGISAPLQASGIALLMGYFFLGFILYKIFKFENLPTPLALFGILPFFFIPKFFNNWAQPSLSWAWLLPMCIYLYRTSLTKSTSERMILWGITGILASSTHTYFLIPVLLVAFVMSIEMLIIRRSPRDEFKVIGALFFGTFFGTWQVGGFNIGLRGSATGVSEVGPYATDILGLVSTYGQSRFLPTIGHLPSFEGQAYLGLGLLVSIVLAIFVYSRHFLIRKNAKNFNTRVLEIEDKGLRFRGLVISGAFLSLIAIGPTFPIAGVANPIGIPDRVLLLFSIFRASGRFVWLAMFLLGIYSLVFLYKTTRKGLFQGILPLILILQIADTYPALDTTRSYISIVTDASQEKLPYISSKDLYFLPGYPDPASTPWRGQVFQTLQNGSRVHYFAYQGRYSSSKIGNSVVESLNLVKNPRFESNSLVFVREDLMKEFLENLKLNQYAYELIKMDTQWTAIRIK